MMDTIVLIFVGLVFCWIFWQIVITATLLFALNVFLDHFKRDKIPHSFKTYFAVIVLRSEIKSVLSNLASMK